LIAQLLIEHGANPDIFNKKDERPIDVALNNGNQSLAALLMRHSHPEIPLQDGSTLFETAIDKFKRNDHSCIRALMDNPRFNVRESIEQATMSGNFEVASFMRQYQAQKELTQTRGQKRKSGSQENSAAKRRKLAEEEEEEEEVCFCCQEPINDTDNPGTQIFQCSHYLHEGCWQGLKSNGYATCQICQASLKEPIAMPTTGKTVAQQEQEERDAMLASLLAADIIDPDELNFFQS
jgi:hypothetical protein